MAEFIFNLKGQYKQFLVIILSKILKSMTLALIQRLERVLPHHKYTVHQETRLLLSSFPYYLLTLILVAAYFVDHSHNFIFIVIIYGILPLLDEIINMDWRNPDKEENRQLLDNNIYFQIALYSAAIADWVLFFKVLREYQNYEFSPFTILNLLGYIFIMSSLNAVQFTIAHQIFHKQSFFHRFIGTVIMSKLLYMHFTYEHIWGHHKRVATPEDPASAQKGITLYRFIKRSFLGSYKSVYQMEKHAGKPFYLNAAVFSVLGAFLFSCLVYRVYGLQTFIIYSIVAALAVCYLEAINYIQHYGLRRQKLENGEYEKVTIRHSWNSAHRISNYLLFKLQRHSDHHENCLKPYQTLVSLEDSPQLSHGYSLTFLMSFFPSKWFAVMDPLVDEYQKLKTGNINGETRQKSNRLIRHFILELLFASIGLCVMNYVLLWMGRTYQEL